MLFVELMHFCMQHHHLSRMWSRFAQNQHPTAKGQDSLELLLCQSSRCKQTKLLVEHPNDLTPPDPLEMIKLAVGPQGKDFAASPANTKLQAIFTLQGPTFLGSFSWARWQMLHIDARHDENLRYKIRILRNKVASWTEYECELQHSLGILALPATQN